jgi:DNA-binding LytR/AlgR family response regulator
MNPVFRVAERKSLSGSDVSSTVRINDLKVGWQRRPVRELVMIRGARGYSWLQWKDGQKQIMAYTLKHYIDQLPEHDFIRVHQNCVINRHFVHKIQLTHRGPMLRLTTGDEVMISRRRWTLVKKELQNIPVGE